MNHPAHDTLANDLVSGSAPAPAEATLRLIASLPAPEGLEDRVRASLLAAPRRGRILAWPTALRPQSGWLRAAAAAAIVVVVAGGGWGVYLRVQQPQAARTVLLMPRGPAQGSFATSGAVRTPQTINGPLVAHPPSVQPVQGKLPAQSTQQQVRHAKQAGTAKDRSRSTAPQPR